MSGDASGSSQEIRNILRLSIHRLSDTKYHFAVVYNKVDGGLMFGHYKLTVDKARSYFEKHGWPLCLPDEDGKLVTVVKHGKFIGNKPPK
jgi:hypothetical protein